MRRRRTRSGVPHPDRRALERTGWRTLLDYREDHIRAEDGTLLVVIPRWTAEAERADGRVVVASVTTADAESVWAVLRRQAERVDRARTSPPLRPELLGSGATA